MKKTANGTTSRRLAGRTCRRSDIYSLEATDTVARQLNEQMSAVGADHFMGMFHIGNLPHGKVMDSLNLFHKEVMPRLR